MRYSCAMNLNKVFILGRLTQDPQVRSLPSGNLVANFGVATNRVFYDKNRQKQEQTEFHNVVAFSRSAEIIQQYLKRGSMILVEGRLQTRSWEGKDGIKRYKTEIIVENLQLGPKNLSQISQGGAPVSKPSLPEVAKEEIPTVEEDSPSQEVINVKDLPL